MKNSNYSIIMKNLLYVAIVPANSALTTNSPRLNFFFIELSGDSALTMSA